VVIGLFVCAFDMHFCLRSCNYLYLYLEGSSFWS